MNATKNPYMPLQGEVWTCEYIDSQSVRKEAGIVQSSNFATRQGAEECAEWLRRMGCAQVVVRQMK